MADILFLGAGFLYFLLSLGRSEWGAAGIALAMPLYLMRVEVKGIPMTVVEIFIYAFFAATVVRYFYDHFYSNKWNSFVEGVKAAIYNESYIKKYGILLFAMGLFVVAALISVVWTPQQVTMIDGQIFHGLRTSLGILKGWIIAPVLYVLAVLAMPSSNGRVLNLLNWYTVSVVVLSGWAIFQMVTQNFVTPDARASGPFESANYLALYMAPAVLYLLVRIKQMLFPLDNDHSGSGWRTAFLRKNIHAEHPELPLLIVAFLLLFVTFIGTKSYAAVLSVFVASIFYFGLEYREYRVRKKNGKLPWKFALGAGILAVLIGVLVFVADPEKWQAMFQFDERNSSSVRLEVYDISTQLIVENWFTGIGMGLYPAEYQVNAVRILGHDPYEWNMLHPHNLFIAFWLNMGLLGLLAFLVLIAVCLQRVVPDLTKFAYMKIHKAPKLRVMGLSLLLIVLVHGLFDTPFFKNDLALLFWIIVLTIMTPSKAGEHKI